MNAHLISLTIVLPFFGAFLQILFERSRWLAFLSSALSSFGVVWLIASVDPNSATLQFSETMSWIQFFKITYDVAVDGLNLLPLLLVAIVFPIAIVSEWDQKMGIRGVHGLLLLLQSGLLGVLYAQDLFLMFFFWAFTTLPFYFLLSIWGDKDREEAAFRYIISSSIGNALFFFSLVLIYYSVDPHTFSLRELGGGRVEKTAEWVFGGRFNLAQVAFFLFSLGMAFRIPIWPIHGWFRHLASQTPTSVAVTMIGCFVPVGIYLYTRLAYTLFPDALFSFAIYILIIGATNVVVGALCTVRQTEVRLFLSYLCLAEVGLLLIGVSSLDSAGLVGAIFQGLVVGLSLAALGLFSGLLQSRTGQSSYLESSGTPVLGGLIRKTPMLALVMGVVLASLLGIPGSGGFVGHALIMMGGYSVHLGAILVLIFSFMVLTYSLASVYRYIFLGNGTDSVASLSDLSLREKGILVPIVMFLMVLGFYPKPFLDLVRPTASALLSLVKLTLGS